MGAMAGDDASGPPEHAAMGHCTPAGGGAMAGMDHGSGGGAMEHSMRDFDVAPQVKRDPSVQTISPMPVDRMGEPRSEEHTSELQSLMRISYAVFCLKKKRQHSITKIQSTVHTCQL